MVSWSEVEDTEPEFAAAVRAIFDAHKHKTIATLRADGSPRISGIEAEFADGEVTFGSMPGSRKGADLARDPRFALHSASVDPPEGAESSWQGDAKIAGRAVVVDGLTSGQSGTAFRAQVAEVVRTSVQGDGLVIEFWRPDIGLRRIARR